MKHNILVYKTNTEIVESEIVAGIENIIYVMLDQLYNKLLNLN